MVVIGLTGSLGMGKTTTLRFFAEAGVPVYDADETVHRLYGGEAAASIEAVFPGTTGEQGVDRAKLAQAVLGDAAALARLEAIVHPLVRREEVRFLEAARKTGVPVAVLDIPLLFETGGEARCDLVLVVSAPRRIQLARVMARPGMTAARLAAIEARQMPDAEKRRLAAVLDPYEVIDRAAGGYRYEAEDEFGRVVLVPHVAAAPRILLCQHRDARIICYPATDREQAPAEVLLMLGRALADPKRIAILEQLRSDDATLAQLSSALGLARSTTHYHLGQLRAARLIALRGNATGYRYTLDPAGFEAAGCALRR